MVSIKTAFQAVLRLVFGRAPASQETGGATVARAIVPIRSLGENQRPRILKHLLALDPRDRYLRFGSVIKDERIAKYVESIDFQRDDVFGIFNRKLDLIAVAHLAYAEQMDCEACAEFGVSVLPHARGLGYGSRLFERATMHSRNEGVQMIFIHALSENTAMLAIARKAGAILQRDGSESEAHLRLAPADLSSQLGSLLDSQLAHSDYQLKVQARQFWRFLSAVQEVRNGVIDAQRRSAP
ncbi:GNAT family N-acetyltransferase [Rhodoferax aquaticus]|uniref:GNAT family N-acetyltransferase n=1 Tax=Rhodoferax aquaticus TaxID=2527691 RepID=A0A515EWA9_9BURK|nr:GNAT family N-acetyltransferase [Rhodoferax aquaticus]